MSASNRRTTKAPAPLIWRCASACVNGFAGLLQGIQSEVVNGLASHHMSNHAYRFVVTERDAFLVQRDRGGQNIVPADQAIAQPPSKQR